MENENVVETVAAEATETAAAPLKISVPSALSVLNAPCAETARAAEKFAASALTRSRP